MLVVTAIGDNLKNFCHLGPKAQQHYQEFVITVNILTDIDCSSKNI